MFTNPEWRMHLLFRRWMFDFGLACANQLWLCIETLTSCLYRVFVFLSNTRGWVPHIICLLPNPSWSSLVKLVVFFPWRPIPRFWKPAFTLKNSSLFLADLKKKTKRPLWKHWLLPSLLLFVSYSAFLCWVFWKQQKPENQAPGKYSVHFWFADWGPQAFPSTCSLTSQSLPVWQAELPMHGLKSQRGHRWAWPWVICRPPSIPVWPKGQMQVSLLFSPQTSTLCEGPRGTGTWQSQHPVDHYSINMKHTPIAPGEAPGL